MKIYSIPILALMLISSSGLAVELTGTAYTIIYRGPTGMPATAAHQPQARSRSRLPLYYPVPDLRKLPTQTSRAPAPSSPYMRVINGRNGQELTRANFNAQIDGYMFDLPFNVQTGTQDVCLVLKNAAGNSLPVRNESQGDDGYAFRNPLWEAEVSRLSELNQVRSELKSLDARLNEGAQELKRIGEEQMAAGMPPGECVKPAPVAPPPRPAMALSTEAAERISGGLCALKWEKYFSAAKINPARLFSEADLTTDWEQRDEVRAQDAEWVSTKFRLEQGDEDLLKNAATKGYIYLEHAEGLRALRRVHQACRSAVLEAAATATRDWLAARVLADEAPVRAVKQCEARLARASQLQQGEASAPLYRAALEKRIADLGAMSPSASQTQRLDKIPCKDL